MYYFILFHFTFLVILTKLALESFVNKFIQCFVLVLAILQPFLVAPCWPNIRMHVLDTSALASFLKVEP